MENKIKEIQIRSETYSQIEQIIKHSGGFKSVSEYVNFVLEELLAPDSRPDLEKSKKIRDRLKGLGYM